MNIKLIGIAGALLALALVVGLVGGAHLINAKSRVGGAVFVTGHDPDYHVQHISCDAPGAQNLLGVAIQYARNGSNKPLLVVHPYDPTIPDGHLNSITGLNMVDTNYVRMNASEFASADLNPKKYSAIYVASDAGGLFAQAELKALNDRSNDIRKYLNAGGGLVALAESNMGGKLTPDRGHFDFLPVPVSSAPHGHSEVGTTLTPYGSSLGLEPRDVNCNYSHNIFGDDGGMNVVDTNHDGQILSLAYRGYFGSDGIVTEDDDGKMSICHATGGTTDPYHLITVPSSAVASHFPGHGDVFPDENGTCPNSR